MSPSDIILSDPDGRQRRFTSPGRYLLARDIAAGHVLYSALRALEAWGHRQVEAGRSLWEVVDDILGADPAPAPLLAVAVDLILTHADGKEPELIPFLGSPELLALDRDRWNRDFAGAFVGHGDEPNGNLPSNTELDGKASRTTCLLWTVDRFAWAADEKDVAHLRDRLIEGSSRLDASPEDQTTSRHEPGWLVRQALWRLDRNNYREQPTRLGDGRTVTVREYVETAEEQEKLAPLRSRSEAESAELATMILAVQGAIDATKRNDELLERALGWAQRQELEDQCEDDSDFERSQRWRALVASAVLAIEAGREEAWASSILERAVAPIADTERRPYNSEIRYYAPALASLGWIGLASRGLASARAELLDLAVRGDRPIITALGKLPRCGSHYAALFRCPPYR